MRKIVRIGMKVRVYTTHGKHVTFGEVIGMDEQGKIILAPRPDYRILALSAFDLFREVKQVKFLNATDKVTV